MNKLLHDMFFQNDGTLDLSRVLWCLGVLLFFGQSLWAQHQHQAWDWQAFGIGFGAVLGGGGVGVMLHGRAS